MPTTVDWLRGRDDDYLVELLANRPDLAIPAPTDLGTLAGRVNQAPSVRRAMESISRFGIEVLTALALMRADRQPVSRGDLTAFLGHQLPPGRLGEMLDQLLGLALVRDDGDALTVAFPVIEVIGPNPAGLGASTGIGEDEVRAALARCPERALGILTALVAGPPVGAVDPAGPVAPIVADLVEQGLLISREPGLVELPREVALQLRGDRPLGELHPDPVTPPPATPGAATVNRTAGGQALEALHQLRRIVDAVTTTPPAALRAGGLGVREVRKLAKELDIPEQELGLYLELLAAANLITTGDPAGRYAPVWTTTENVDSWLAGTDEEAWASLARHWLDLRRDPTRVGEPGVTGKPPALLSGELSWLRGPAERRWVLQPLAELPAGSGWSPAALGEVLGWRSPLRSAERRDRLIATVIREATLLGVVAFDSLTGAGRALLDGTDEVASRLAEALPTPGRTIVVQADLTVVAPGRLESDLAEELAVAAEVESAGSATVYRVTPTSIRRALDRGRSAAELHRLFADHAVTSVPQTLSYLIDDIARRHGVLRAGMAQSYLRCEDPVLIDQAVAAVAPAGILLRRLAPTVAITSAETDELLSALRRAGLVPMAEDEFGAMVTLEPRPRRLRGGLVTHQRWREPAAPSSGQLAALVERLRAADTSDAAAPQSATETIGLLREAANHRRRVWIEYVNAEGSASRRLVEPVALSGGSVAAFDRLSGQLRTFVLHRVTSVRPHRADTESAEGAEPAAPAEPG